MKQCIRSFILILSAFLILASPSLRAQSTVSITLNPNQPGATIPDDFNGVSYETSTLLTSYFRSTNQPLLRMFSQLGIKSLRIGGNTSDSGTLPSQAQIASAFDFANAANIKVIYGLRLKTFDPQANAATANFILSLNSPSLACFAVGNEPDVYLGGGGYPTYRSDAQAYYSAISNPRAKFCGPDVTGGASSWVVNYANDFVSSGRIAWAQRHNYFGGSGQAIGATAARDLMLSTTFVSKYQASHDAYASQCWPPDLLFGSLRPTIFSAAAVLAPATPLPRRSGASITCTGGRHIRPLASTSILEIMSPAPQPLMLSSRLHRPVTTFILSAMA